MFHFSLQDDPSRAEGTEALEHAIKFPTSSTLADLAKVQGGFEGW